MAKQLLIETRMNAFEGVKPSTRKGCLGTMSGPCADFKNPTRNGNFYSRKLWENVFKDDLVKESLEDRVLIGELDHPGDRLESKAQNACIVMTGYSFDDNEGVVNGTFDILDTPNGRLLKSLLDYGCKIGVSSRGEGDVTESAGQNNVDEDSYYFVGFDAVALPAVKKAKPALQESLKRTSLKESLMSQINEAKSRSELDIIKKVVESMNLPEVDSILESIENRSNELEGVADSSNLLEDLERLTSQNQSLLDENRSLKKEVTACKSKVKRFLSSRIKLDDENSQLTADFERLNESHSDLIFKLSSKSNELSLCESVVSQKSREIVTLQKKLNSERDLHRSDLDKIASLEESLRKSQSHNNKLLKDNKLLSEKLEHKEKEYSDYSTKSRKELSESKSSIKKLQKNNIDVLRSYASNKANSLGCQISDNLLESIKPSMSIVEVDKLLQEDLDRSYRYSTLPVKSDSVICALSEATVSFNKGVTTQINPEDERTREFMESIYKN